MQSDRSNAASSRSMRARAVLLASVAALVVTSFEANAAPAAARPSSADSQVVAATDTAEFGARRRIRRGNGAAGLAMMGMMVGTIGAVIAAQQRREAYEASYNRAHAYYGYGHPQPYVYHQPRVYHRPHVYHGHHGYRTHDGQPPTPPLINGHRVGW